jgi:hypothetical protein
MMGPAKVVEMETLQPDLCKALFDGEKLQKVVGSVPDRLSVFRMRFIHEAQGGVVTYLARVWLPLDPGRLALFKVAKALFGKLF